MNRKSEFIGSIGPWVTCPDCSMGHFPKLEMHECPTKLKEMEKQFMITTEQANQQEAKAIVEHLDGYVWYDMPTELHAGVKAKSGQVLTALVYILVDKGLLSLDDVKRITKG